MAANSYSHFDDTSDHQSKQKWIRRLLFVFLVVVAAVLLIVVLVTAKGHKSHGRSGPATDTVRRVLWISDLHLDPLFDPSCDRRTFCRAPSGGDCDRPSYTRGMGSFGCDSPSALLRETLEQARKLGPYEFTILTGDMSAHRSPSLNSTIAAIEQATQMVRATIGDRVLATLGNNDFFPDYCLPFGTNPWLSSMAVTWQPWLSFASPTANLTFHQGGYFVARPLDGVVVVSLNTLLWSALHQALNCTEPTTPVPVTDIPDDPDGQMSWLEFVLQSARHDGERVFVVGHIPPGRTPIGDIHDPQIYCCAVCACRCLLVSLYVCVVLAWVCVGVCAGRVALCVGPSCNAGMNGYDGRALWHDKFTHNFTRIMNQYSDVVAMQFWAHFHRDDLRMGAGTPAMLMSSVTPIYDNNPAFRILHLQDNALVDYEHHFFDLAAFRASATLSGFPPASEGFWRKEYSFSDYGVSMDTQGFNSLYALLILDSTVYSKYNARRLVQATPNRPEFLCAMTEVTSEEYGACVNASL